MTDTIFFQNVVHELLSAIGLGVFLAIILSIKGRNKAI